MAKKFFQINQYIKAPSLRVVDSDASQVGVLSRDEALALAKSKGLDLVMVAPSAKPPVAKIVDFSNFKYQIKKRDQTSKKKSKAGDTKELRMTPFIAENDLNTRIKKVKEFLADGDRVKINVKFVGRQITRKEFGHELVDRITTALTGAGSIDQPAKMMGKMLTVVYKPVPKNKKPNS